MDDVSTRPAQVPAPKVPVAVPPQLTREKTEDDKPEVCFLCASDVSFHAVPPCNHWTCHVCSLRMRALMWNKACAYCKAEVEYVIFTDDGTKTYESFAESEIITKHENIGIKYASLESLKDTVALLQYRCPFPGCDIASAGWPGLHQHVREVHQRKMCDLCIKGKKVFTHEVQLFTDPELKKHMREGDDKPGAVDQTGFRGHPLCEFCGSRHYGVDELYDHLKKNHEKCFICSEGRRGPGGAPVYLPDIASLQQHYRDQHFLCTAAECAEQGLIVFATEMDLKAHQLEAHADSLSKDVRRDARMVDMSAFDYRQPYQPSARGDRSHARGGGRGRDPNAEPLPSSSAHPMRRDEQAFQRQMAVQSAQSVAPRTFGGQLTAGPGPSRPANARAAHAEVREASDALARFHVSAEPRAAAATAQEQARALRHAAVIDRATTLLGADAAKISQFRNTISSYQRGAISATALIESFRALFDTAASSTLGTLIRELADIFEDPGKAASLRSAWNDWRAIHEDYPSLPDLNLSHNSLPLGWAVSASSSSAAASRAAAPPSSQNSARILQLKSSTAQSLRSFDAGAPSRITAAATNTTTHATNVAFPELPAPSRTAVARSAAGRGGTTPWAGAPSSATTHPSHAPSQKPAPSAARPEARATRGGGGGASNEAFPALPPAPKPLASLTGHGGRLVRKDWGGGAGGAGQASSTTGFAWGGADGGSVGGGGGGGGSGSGSHTPEGEAGAEDTKKKKKKGNKGKKQVLMGWG